MKINYNKKNYPLIYGSIIIIFFVMSFIVFNVQKDFSDYTEKGNKYIPKEWILSIEGREDEEISLPNFVKYNSSGQFNISTKIEENMDKYTAPVVLIQSNHMFMDAYLDEELIYSYSDQKKPVFSKSPGNYYRIINLPRDCGGKTIKFTLKMPLGDSIKYEIPKIVFGDKTNILYCMFENCKYYMIIITILEAAGVFLIILEIIFRKKFTKRELLHIGMLCLVLGTYLICENDFLVLISPAPVLCYYLDFMLFSLIPVPLLYLLKSKTLDIYVRRYNILIFIFIMNFCLQVILHFAHIRDLREMLGITHIIDIGAMILVIHTCLISHKVNKVDKKFFAFKLLPIVIGGLIDLLMHTMHIPFPNTMFLQIGIVFALIVKIIESLKSLFELYRVKVKTDFYRKMAYTDALTNLNNRAAYELALDKFDENKFKPETVFAVYIDVNNLKEVNDAMGHKEGDKIIKVVADILSETFEEKGYVFRMGGDEFTILIYGVTQEQLNYMVEKLNYKVEAYNKNSSIKISFALGYSNIEESEHHTLQSALLRADKLMYNQKQNMKINQKNKLKCDLKYMG